MPEERCSYSSNLTICYPPGSLIQGRKKRKGVERDWEESELGETEGSNICEYFRQNLETVAKGRWGGHHGIQTANPFSSTLERFKENFWLFNECSNCVFDGGSFVQSK